MTYPTIDIVANYLSSYFGMLKINTTPIRNTLSNMIGKGSFYALYGTAVRYESITGIDIPVFFDNNGKETIMIIERDPYRTTNDKQLVGFKSLFTSHGIVGTPNALHLPQTAYPNSRIYRDLINQCANKGYKIYLTDVYKVYALGLVGLRGRFGKNEQKLLVDEIKCIKPDKILLTGQDAQMAYFQISSLLTSSPFPIFAPHLTGARASSWLKYGVSSTTYSEKLNYLNRFI